MKIAKVLVLTLFLAVAGYASVISQHAPDSNHKKAAACMDGQSCCAQMECCKPGAACCEPGASCCDAKMPCCEKDKQGDSSANAAMLTGSTGSTGSTGERCASKAGCCTAPSQADKATAKADAKPQASDAKHCCGTPCNAHSSTKK